MIDLHSKLKQLDYQLYIKAINRSEAICLKLRGAGLNSKASAMIERSVVGIYLEFAEEKAELNRGG